MCRPFELAVEFTGGREFGQFANASLSAPLHFAALLWIDPLDYQADLACGVDMLRAAGVKVSIYNLRQVT